MDLNVNTCFVLNLRTYFGHISVAFRKQLHVLLHIHFFNSMLIFFFTFMNLNCIYAAFACILMFHMSWHFFDILYYIYLCVLVLV